MNDDFDIDACGKFLSLLELLNTLPIVQAKQALESFVGILEG